LSAKAELPIHIDIKADESTYGWLIRLSHINCLRLPNLFDVGCSNRFRTQQKWNYFKYKGHITKQLWDDHSANHRLRFNSIIQAKSAFVIRDYEFNFCPLCLAEDKVPFIRFHWHATWLSYCHVHGIKMLSGCTQCKGRISYKWEHQWMTCNQCGMPLKEAEHIKCDHTTQLSSTTHAFVNQLLLNEMPEYKRQEGVRSFV